MTEMMSRQQYFNVEQHVSKVSEAGVSSAPAAQLSAPSLPETLFQGVRASRALRGAHFLRLKGLAWPVGVLKDRSEDVEWMSQIVVDASVELPGQMNFDFGFEDVDAMLLDPPDPVDLLIAHTHEAQGAARPLDFVRAKMGELKKENSRLKSRCAWIYGKP